MYNRELEEVRRMELPGKSLSYVPAVLLKSAGQKTEPEKIQQMYDLGRLDGMKALRDTAVF